MKYMLVWFFPPENEKAVRKRFMEANPVPPPGVKIVGRWHEMGTGKGFTLFESDDPVGVSKVFLAWGDLVYQKVVPVLDDQELSKALGA